MSRNGVLNVGKNILRTTDFGGESKYRQSLRMESQGQGEKKITPKNLNKNPNFSKMKVKKGLKLGYRKDSD